MDISEFKLRPETIKGTIGEDFVDEYYKPKWVLMSPLDADSSHEFDRVQIARPGFPEMIRLLEIKTNNRRKSYDDTGINYEHWLTYLDYHKPPDRRMWLVFVDPLQGKVYGQYLDVLEQKVPKVYWFAGRKKSVIYPWHDRTGKTGGKVYFLLDSFAHICVLPWEVREKLNAIETRKDPRYVPSKMSVAQIELI